MDRRDAPSLYLVLAFLWLTTLATACGPAAATPAIPAPTSVPAPNTTEASPGAEQPASTPVGGSGQVSSVQDLATVIAQRTLVPTPTPGPVEAFTKRIAAESGLGDRRVLGLQTADWIDLGISALGVLLGSVLGTWLLFGLLNWAIRRTKTRFDDKFLEAIERELKWLVVAYLARFALLRLDIWTDELRTATEDLFFVLILGIFCLIAVRLIRFAASQYRAHLGSEAEKRRLDPLIATLRRLGYFLVGTIALSIVLSHLGINVTLATAVVLIVGLVLAIGARAAIADGVAGFLILLDRPYRVGDAILIKELESWGDVVEIGIRSTRIHALDNREVIIPNSLIGQSQVVNYSYPDPSLRVQTDIGVAYGTDIDLMEQVITKTVRGVQGVLPDRPVDVLFVAYGDSARQICVRWWIDDVNDQHFTLHRVNAALERALAEAGIDMPFPTYNLNLQAKGENGGRSTQALSDASGGKPRW